MSLPERLTKAIDRKLAQREQLLAPWTDKITQRVGETPAQEPAAISRALSEKTISITSIDDYRELARKIANRELSALDVVTAYAERAALAHLAVNPITEVLLDSAIDRAKELDAHLAKTGKVVGPLHGIPISVKDAFDVAGVDSSLGYASNLEKPRSVDALAVQIIRQAGGIILCKTNNPQALKWGETDNFVWGKTSLPHNPGLTPGGSSGGEGALLASKGSLIGFGTDIGGSVRMPAANCGLYTLRPTMRRLPNLGVSNSMTGLASLESVIGPLSRTLSGTIDTFKLLVDARPADKDAVTVDLPWRREIFESAVKGERPLVFGLQAFDGEVFPHPPTSRALTTVAHALQAAGHEVVDFPPWNHKEGVRLFDEFMQLDRGADHALATAQTGEPMFPGNLSEFQPNTTQLTGAEIMALNHERDVFRQGYLDHWQSIRSTSTGQSVDVVIGPVMAHAAPPHRQFKYLGYTKIWSFLDYPAGVVPVTNVDAAIDKLSPNHVAVSKADEENVKLWSADVFDKMPVGIQVIGKRFHEEEVLAGMQIISKAIGVEGPL